MKTFLHRYWRYLVSATAVALLVIVVGPRQLAETISNANVPLLMLFAVGFALTPALYGLQLYGTFRILGHPIELVAAIRSAVAAWSVGILTPARTGDLTLGFFVRPHVPSALATAVVVLDKLLSLAFLAAVAVIAAFALSLSFAPVVAVAGAAVAFGVLVLIGAVRSPTVSRAVGKVMPARLRSMSKDTAETVRAIVSRADYLGWTALMVVARWSVMFGLNMILFRAVNTEPSFGVVAAATSVGRLLALVPVSVGGLGVKEPFQIVIYETANVPAEAVIAASVLGAASAYLAAAVLPLVVRRRSERARVA